MLVSGACFAIILKTGVGGVGFYLQLSIMVAVFYNISL